MASKKGKRFPKKGNSLHFREPGGPSYEALIAAALRGELGGSHRAVKTLVTWTGACPRTTKNWLSGVSGPSGAHLILLLARSDKVFEAVLSRTKRQRPEQPDRVAGARLLLADAISLLNG